MPALEHVLRAWTGGVPSGDVCWRGIPLYRMAQAMRRTRQRSRSRQAGAQPGDGAELPLLHPRLLPQLSHREEEGRTPTSEGECLILSENELGAFDADRVDEVRRALSAEVPATARPPGSRITRRLTSWKRWVLAACYFAFAVGAGVAIGWLL